MTTTYKGRYTGVVRHLGGEAARAVPVTVYQTGTLTKATLYRDAAAATQADNPVISDNDTGRVSFFAAPGTYDLAWDGQTIAGVEILPDPAEQATVPEVVAAFTVAGGLSVGAVAAKVPAPFAATLTGIRLAVGTGPVGADLLVDVNKAGVTVFTTQTRRAKVVDGGTSGGPGTAPNVTAVAAGDLLSIDVDQVGSDTAGSDLTVLVLGTRA